MNLISGNRETSSRLSALAYSPRKLSKRPAPSHTIQTANNPIRLSAAGERPKTARSPLLDEHREALIQEFMTINGHAKLSQIRQLAATDNIDLSFVNLTMQQ
jgi:hypothetical protein